MKPGTVESGAACRAHILELLAQKNMSGADLAPIVGRKIPTVLGYLRDLRANDKVHIAARCGHNLNIKLYAFGPGQDASNLAQRVLAALQERPMTSKELCQALDESPVTVRKTCEHLRWGEDKSVYVADWTRPESAYNRAVHVYAVGNLPDKPKPRPLTRKETSARARKKRRAKLKADPVLYVNHLMIKRRSYARTKTSVAKPDAFMAQFAGLFGARQAA